MSGTGEPFDGAPPRPSPPRPPRESIVIEGKATHPVPPRSAAAGLFGRAREFRFVAAGLIGALVGLAGASLLAPGPDWITLSRRLDALEAAATGSQAQIDALVTADKTAEAEGRARDERLAALAAATPPAAAQLEARLTALEQARGEDESKAKAVDAAFAGLRADLAAAATQQKSLADEIARLRSAALDAAALDQRLAALEAGALRADVLAPVAADARAAREAADKALAVAGAKPDFAADQARLAASLSAEQDALAALRGRLDKLEAAMFASKAETRVAAASSSDSGGGATARAVAALALRQRWRLGEPIGDELATLNRLGVDASALAPLRPFANSGAPSADALTRAFESVKPQLLVALRPPPPAGAVDRLFGEMQGLVKVRKLGESYGAEAGVPRVEAALARDDLDAALAAIGDWPSAGQDAARTATAAIEARRSADRAAEALARRAVAELSGR